MNFLYENVKIFAILEISTVVRGNRIVSTNVCQQWKTGRLAHFLKADGKSQ